MAEHEHDTTPALHSRQQTPNLGELRSRLAESRPPEQWRSLSELAGTPEFEEKVHREFPRQAAEWPEGVSRRGFMELAGASLALAGLSACTRQPQEKIVPYVKQPEDIIPGKPLFYATSLELGGYGMGVLTESHMGRPTKVEGNPDHPGSLGATDLFAQAAILGLYDPDRSQVVKKLGRTATYSLFVDELKARLPALTALSGEGLAFLTGAVSSPTLAGQFAALRRKFPKARWCQWEPAGRHHAHTAALAAFGAPVATRYDLSVADVIVALDADFLVSGPGAVRYARDFARRRRVLGEPNAAAMNRLYSVESSPTATSAQADHRLAISPAGVAAFAASLAAELGVAGAAAQPYTGPEADKVASWIKAVAADLSAHRGKSAVIAGDSAAPAVHVLAHAINELLGNVGTSVLHTQPVLAEPTDQVADLENLVAEMRAGRVDTLLILGANPVYDAPAELRFAEALEKVRFRVHLALDEDETSDYCQWHLPAAHPFETWGDTRSFDGTLSLIQPVIEPLYGGKSLHEILALFGDTTDATTYELVRTHWQSVVFAGANGSFESQWRRAVHDGLVKDSQAPALAHTVRTGAVAEAAALLGKASERGMVLAFRPDPTIYDGRFANNGWLQEVPKPLTKLTWDNALLLSPRDAERLAVTHEAMVEVEAGGTKLEVPVLVQPGAAEGVATLHLGYGRTRGGRVATGHGVNAYALRSADSLWARPVSIRRVSGHHLLATTQEHFDIALQTEEAASRHHVRHATLADFIADPQVIEHMGHHAFGEEGASMFPPHPYTGYSWGLTVDLSACTGCNACVIACQSENNIPVVGKEQVAKGREMHWIRIDRYFEGDLDEPGTHHQPVMCMHCDLAPCEIVCPVAATNHGPEGLNEMVYNRCVGTRYCSNNCPYKVRRFNFLLYSDFETEVLKLSRNPDVTVRSRGVMEKCTYCVQRINLARIDAKREGRKIRDGEVTTACQQVCPAEAISFGNMNDASAEVNRWKASPRNYGLLEELNTQPRTTYLAKLTNPNPALLPAGTAHHEGGHAA